ncbi:Cation efflux system protein [Azospirillaceae bacterium]
MTSFSAPLTAQPHDHRFLGEHHDQNERRTVIVIALTSVMMVGEIVAGNLFGSMALIADGWHMSTHAGALAIAAIAYRYAKKYSNDSRFAFGAAKLGDLAGFSSALALAAISILIGVEACSRLIAPIPIAFNEALLVAILGLAVNLLSARLLQHEHEHGHHDRDHSHHSSHVSEQDNNLKAAYLHVLADALTSVAAILALLAGRFYGWIWMDALTAIIGSIVIAIWSYGLIRESGAALLDMTATPALSEAVRHRLEQHGEAITDFHLWRLGPGHYGVIASLASNTPCPPDHYKKRLEGLLGLSHVTIEVNSSGHTPPNP